MRDADATGKVVSLAREIRLVGLPMSDKPLPLNAAYSYNLLFAVQYVARHKRAGRRYEPFGGRSHWGRDQTKDAHNREE